MSSKTKIVVLHMKEVVYTAVFLALALILLVVFLIMFSGKKDSAKKPSVTTAASAENARYIPGIYTSTISLGDQTFDVQVNVEQDRITAISLNNLSETTAAMYPLMEPALDSIASQIYVNQTTASSTERTTATPPNCSSPRSIRRSNRLKILPPQNPDLSMQKGLEAFFCSEAFFLSCISKFDCLHQFGLSLFVSVFPVLFFTAGRVPLSRASRTHHSAYAGRRAGIPQRFRPSGHPAGRSV